MSKSKQKKILDVVESEVASIANSNCQWALDIYKAGHANDWSPYAIPMDEDAKQWRMKDFLSEDEKLLVKRVLGLFAAGESSVGNSVDYIEKKYLTDGAVRQALVRKLFEQSLHNLTVSVCISSFNLTEEECIMAYQNVKTIQEKERYMDKVLKTINDDANFDISSVEGKRAFVKVMATFYLIVEGSWFFTNFVALLALKRQGKLTNLGKQIDYTIRDETQHVLLGTSIINQIRKDYPEVFSKEFNQELIEHIKEGIDLEDRYIKQAIPNGILGVTGEMLLQFCKYQCNAVLKDAGINFKYPDTEAKNNFPWINETVNSPKKTNFFESHETSYQSKTALKSDDWDEI